jgi:GT2 family glycosyltransferase
VDYPRVSIIIPFATMNDFAAESLEHCLSLEYQDFEILLFPDGEVKIDSPRVRVIPTGHIGPSEKRDLALKYAAGQILAFIDDDAYPTRMWLKQAVKHFRNSNTAAVGGPAITPPGDSLLRQASGLVFSSIMGSGFMTYRYIPGKKRKVDDYPSCNFIIRTSVFRELGGFDSTFWPGEDTKLCLELTKTLHKEIVYDPEVVVYHHRRNLFRPHLRQVWSYAVHRGYFAKKFPQTSFRLAYFIPTIFVLGILGGIGVSFVSPLLRTIFLSIMAVYLILALLSSLKSRDIRLIPLVLLGIIATHLTYGIGLIKGLLTARLSR